MSSDLIIISLYLFRKYQRLLLANEKSVVETMNDSLGLYSDTSLREQRSNGIMFLEEKLYLFELFSEYMTYPSALKYVKTI